MSDVVNSKRMKYDYEKICYLYRDEKKTPKEISEMLNISRHTVGNIVSRLGLADKNNKNGSKPRKYNHEEICRLYSDEGKTLKEIAEILNMPRRSVGVVVSKYGLSDKNNPRRNKVKKTKYNHDEIFYLYFREGKSAKEISEILFIPMKAVARVIFYYGKNYCEDKSGDIDLKKICQLYFYKHMSFEKISAEVGNSCELVQWIIQRFKLLNKNFINKDDTITMEALAAYIKRNLVPGTKIGIYTKCSKKKYKYNIGVVVSLNSYGFLINTENNYKINISYTDIYTKSAIIKILN